MHSSIESEDMENRVCVCVGKVKSDRKKLMNGEKGEEDGLKECRRYNNYSLSAKLTIKRKKNGPETDF